MTPCNVLSAYDQRLHETSRNALRLRVAGVVAVLPVIAVVTVVAVGAIVAVVAVVAVLSVVAVVVVVVDFLKVRFCRSPVGRKTDFSHLQRAKFYRPDFRSAVCPGVWQQLSPIRNRHIIWRHFPGNPLKCLPSITESKWMCEKP